MTYKEYKEEILKGLKNHEIPMKSMPKIMKELDNLSEEEFKNTETICFKCKHCFWMRFIRQKVDPLLLFCKIRVKHISNYRSVDCNADFGWYRKVLECSDFEVKDGDSGKG